jgi:hypothetical protein
MVLPQYRRQLQAWVTRRRKRRRRRLFNTFRISQQPAGSVEGPRGGRGRDLALAIASY